MLQARTMVKREIRHAIFMLQAQRKLHAPNQKKETNAPKLEIQLRDVYKKKLFVVDQMPSANNKLWKMTPQKGSVPKCTCLNKILNCPRHGSLLLFGRMPLARI